MQSALERVWDDFDRIPDFSLYDNRDKGELLRAGGGLRRLSFMLLTEVRFARKVRGVPFMTILCPSQRYHQEKGVRHRKLTDLARQAILLIQRWFSDYSLIFVGDSNKNYKD